MSISSQGIISYTTDGGISWAHNDGGKTWIQSPTPNIGQNYLYSIFFINTTCGWAVGNGGTILKYGSITSIGTEKEPLSPQGFDLSQNFPNPFNPITRIRYSVLNDMIVNIKVYDILGREVMVLVNEIRKKGSYEIIVDGSSLSSGIYFYRMTGAGNSITRKFLLMK